MKASTQSFATNIGELRRLSTWVRECAAEAGVMDSLADRIELCVNEAAANIILHAAAEDATGQFAVEFDDEGDRVAVTMIDGAGAFDPRHHPPLRQFTSIEGAPTGGYGIHLLRTLAASVDYRREGGRNILTLWFDRQRTKNEERRTKNEERRTKNEELSAKSAGTRRSSFFVQAAICPISAFVD
jgi:serine/threonine-protein kinase RsbW